MCLAVSVDWEGAFLDEDDIAAMVRFAQDAPDVPLTHLLNGAYFTKPDADADAIARQMRRVIGVRDETGLHVHAWESLVRAAGVTPRSGPLFLSAEALDIDGDPGFDVELEAYTVNEIRALLATSRLLLGEAGFVLSGSFRTGGWLAGHRVLEAARREGFTIDTSATDHAWLDELATAPLPAMVRARWPTVDSGTQPFSISTPAGSILELPDTGGLADYVTTEEMIAHVGAAVAAYRDGGRDGGRDGRPQFVQLGFHQEGAVDYAPRVVAALRAIARTHGDAIRYATLEQCAADHRPPP